jgi:hypothetical protein
VGPIVPMSKKKRYILVCIDYVTKWVEAKDLFMPLNKALYIFYLRIFSLVLVFLEKL